MGRVIRTVMRKELIQTFRDRRMLFILFIAPALQTTIFGFAVNLDLTSEPAVVADLDRTETSRRIIDIVRESPSFELLAVTDEEGVADEMIWRGQAVVAVHIPHGFAKKLEQGEAELLVVLDGSDANTAVRAGQELGQALNNDAAKRQREVIEAAIRLKGLAPERMIPSMRIEPRVWYNPQLRTAVFLVPGVLAMVLLVITMMLTSMGLTREKELGTLEQVMVSPLKPVELIIGKTVPFAALGMIDVLLVVCLAVLVFHVPVRGSLFALFGASGIFLITTLGLGLFVSTISATQQQAMMNAFFIMLPALMLSGFVFPVENMPPFAKWLAAANPLTYYIAIARGLMVKGAAVQNLLEQILYLTIIGLTVMTAAALRFRKRIA